MWLSRPFLTGFIFRSFDCNKYLNNLLFLLWVFCLLLQLYEVSNLPTRSAMIKVQKLCVEYVVQVRCRALDGLGYWSNWSKSAYAVVRDIKGMCAFRACSDAWCSFRLRCDTVLSKLSSCSSLTRPWVLESYCWRSSKEAEKCYPSVEGENTSVLVFRFERCMTQKHW